MLLCSLPREKLVNRFENKNAGHRVGRWPGQMNKKRKVPNKTLSFGNY
nr:MAG TPA: hypothetical protein [Caudoviricetes sp.]